MVAIKVSTVDPLPLDGEWKHVFFTYDGSGKAAGVKIYVNGTPVPTRVVSDTLRQCDDPDAGSHAAGMAISRCNAGAGHAVSRHPAVWARADVRTK